MNIFLILIFMIHGISVDAVQQSMGKKVLASSPSERQDVARGIAFEKIYLDRSYDMQRELVQLIDAQRDIIFDAQGFIILYNTLTILPTVIDCDFSSLS